MNVQDIIAALSVVINGIPQAILALTFGFLAFPTALGYLVGVVACLILGSAVPISMQAETIALIGTMGRNIRERLSMVFYAGLIMTVLGMTGLLTKIVDLAGDQVIYGMMAGVGIILTRIAIQGFRDSFDITAVSCITAIATYFISGYNLVMTVTVSVILTSIYANVMGKEIGAHVQTEARKLEIKKTEFNRHILRGSLALSCLTIGANIAFGSITASLGAGAVNIDHLTIYSGIADSVSALFGGAPVESIISATGAAPHPFEAGILMMAMMAAILFAGLLPKLGRIVPGESVYGFLLVLGALVTIPTNAGLAFGGAEGAALTVAGASMAITAVTDPFYGLIVGLILKLGLGA